MPADLLPPPNTPFGHPLRGLWSLEPGIRFLNHGSFGAVPQRLTFVDTQRERRSSGGGDELFDHYPDSLEALDSRKGLLGLIFNKPQNKLQIAA